MSKRETIRRLRVGDVRRVLQHRCGATLPDDDAGRDDLDLLLRLHAVASNAAEKKMRCRGRDLGPLDAQGRGHGPNRQPLRCDLRRVWLGGKELGQRLNLTNAEREALKAWRIVPVDMTADDLAEQWKAKEGERKRRKRATYWVPNHVKPMRPGRYRAVSLGLPRVSAAEHGKGDGVKPVSQVCPRQ